MIAFLDKKREDSELVIQRLTKKRRLIKILYYTTTISAIVISAVLGTLSATIWVPPVAISVLSTCSAILTAISTKFNFKEKNHEINKEIENLISLKNTIEYAISCNGKEKFKEVLDKFA